MHFINEMRGKFIWIDPGALAQETIFSFKLEILTLNLWFYLYPRLSEKILASARQPQSLYLLMSHCSLKLDSSLKLSEQK